jgi:hypothetical protein
MYTVVFLVNLLVSQGLSIVGTNLLCHRYLCEKARVMINLYALPPPPLFSPPLPIYTTIPLSPFT